MIIKLLVSFCMLFCLLTVAHADVKNTLNKQLTMKERIEMVKAHNDWRQKVGVPNLTWSNTLASTAEQYAVTLSRTGCEMTHSGNGYGENIYWASPLIKSYSSDKKIYALKAVSAPNVSTPWAAEIKDYAYKNNTCRKGAICGHYTQMVWKSTTEVGCGKAACSNNAQIWVCNYNPPGNVAGQKPY